MIFTNSTSLMTLMGIAGMRVTSNDGTHRSSDSSTGAFFEIFVLNIPLFFFRTRKRAIHRHSIHQTLRYYYFPFFREAFQMITTNNSTKKVYLAKWYYLVLQCLMCSFHKYKNGFKR